MNAGRSLWRIWPSSWSRDQPLAANRRVDIRRLERSESGSRHNERWAFIGGRVSQGPARGRPECGRDLCDTARHGRGHPAHGGADHVRLRRRRGGTAPRARRCCRSSARATRHGRSSTPRARSCRGPASGSPRGTWPSRSPGSSSRCTACSWRRSAPAGCSDGGRQRRRRGPRSVRGGHRHRGPLPAPHGLEDVLRLLDRVRRRRPEHPRVPGLPRPPGHAADDQPAGGRVRDRGRARHRRDHPRAHPVGAQELLLPGPAQGLPDQPVRDPARRRRAARDPDLRRAVHRPHPAGPPRGGHRQARPRGPGRADRHARVPRRLQPLGRPADGDRHRGRHPDRRAGAALRRGAAAAAPRHRRQRRGHGARPDAGRGERLAAAARREPSSGRGSRSRT